MESVFEKEVRPLLDLIDSLRQLGVNQVQKVRCREVIFWKC